MNLCLFGIYSYGYFSKLSGFILFPVINTRNQRKSKAIRAKILLKIYNLLFNKALCVFDFKLLKPPQLVSILLNYPIESSYLLRLHLRSYLRFKTPAKKS